MPAGAYSIHFILRICILYAALFLCTLTGSAQHPYFYNLNNENGLPSNEVYQVRQDSFGYIWIACDAGLFRYDGLRFVAFTNRRQNSKSVSNIVIDRQGGTWCQNFTGQIFHVPPGADSLAIIYNDSRTATTFPSYTIDQAGNAWIATDSALLVVNNNGKLLQELNFSRLFAGNLWSDIECGADGRIYASDLSGNYAIIHARTFKSQIVNAPAPGNINTLLRIGNRMYLYVETRPRRSYHLEDITNGIHRHVADYKIADDAQCYIIAETPLGPILCTSEGARILSTGYQDQQPPNLLFPGKKISWCFPDREGNYWFTSLQDGIFVMPAPGVQVFNTLNSPLTDENISALARGRTGLLVGTYTGDSYTLSVPGHQMTATGTQAGAQNRAVKKMAEQGGKLYIAQGNFNIYYNGRAETVPELNNTRDFVLVGDTIFYTGSHSTGFVVRQGKRWTRTVTRKKGGKKVAYSSAEQRVYFACTDGLFACKNGINSPITFEDQPVYASCLLYDNDTLWVGTTNNGVLAYHNGRMVTSFHALPDLAIKALEKSGNTLFAATLAGISVVNLQSRKTDLINEYDGVACKEVNALVFLDTMLYAATIRGIITIPLQGHYANPVPPSVKITWIRKNNERLPSSLSVSLKHSDNNLTIGFSAASFRSRGNFRYRYLLSGFDDEWHYINGNNPQVNFSSLPPGDYLFLVFAANEDGVQTLEPAQLAINVSAPVWQQWWFIALVLCLIILGIALIFRARLRYVKRKAEERNKLIASQLTALKAQMNPHFMYNALNSIQAFIINNDVKNSNLYLNKFSKLMRKVLDASDAEHITLQDEIDILELYLSLEQFRFGAGFSYHISISDNIDSYNTLLPSMILQPFIENAIKHGLLHKKGDKQLDIRFHKDTFLVCTITDNGIGRKKTSEIRERSGQHHRSFATGATEKRIELLNAYTSNRYSFEVADLYDAGQPSGTRVTIRIPI